MFTGDFHFLPFRASVVYGDVPTHPTAADFHCAVTDVQRNLDDAAAHWRLEAIRLRRQEPGVPLGNDAVKLINQAVAKRLFEARFDER